MDLQSVILLCFSAGIYLHIYLFNNFTQNFSLKSYHISFSATVFGNVIKPDKPDVFTEEGSSVTLSCSFTDSGGLDYLHWYRQYGRSKPEFLVLTYSTANKAKVSVEDPRFTVNVTKREHVDLKISSAAVSDSAVYYCALQPTVTGNTSTLYKNLLQWETREKHRDREENREKEAVSSNYEPMKKTTTT